MADEEFRNALQQVSAPWWLTREAVSSTRMDRDETHIVGEVPAPLRPCPECIAGKHYNCPGQTWDPVLDAPVDCPCDAPEHAAA